MTAKEFLDYFQWVYQRGGGGGLGGGLSLDSSVFNENLSLKRKIINLTHQRFGLTRVLYSCTFNLSGQVRPLSIQTCIKIVPTMQRSGSKI